MSTVHEDQKFIDDVFSKTLLEKSIKWIGDHMTPGEVFSYSELSEWAQDNSFKKEAE